MAHVRQQIRDAIITQVTGLTTTGTNVFSHRVYPLQEGALPALMVSTLNESISASAMGTFGSSTSIIRNLSVTVEGYVKATSAADDTLDTIAEEVEAALGDDETLGGLVEYIELSSTQLSFEGGDSDQPVGIVSLNYDVLYRTTHGDAAVNL